MSMIRQKGTRVVPVAPRRIRESNELTLDDVRKLVKDKRMFVRYKIYDDVSVSHGVSSSSNNFTVLEVADRLQDIIGYQTAPILTIEELEVRYGKQATDAALEKFYAEQDEVAAMYREAHAKAKRKKAKE